MNFIVILYIVALKLIEIISLPIFWILQREKKHKVSRVTDKLLTISATDLARKIRLGELTSTEVCSAYIKRIKEVNPIINAVSEERFESALQDAAKIDSFLQARVESIEELEKTKPLLGVPLTVKESCSLAGLSLAVGTLSRRGVKATFDGDVVARLKSSGAIPLLVSNTPELSLSWECFNFINGDTRNPYDTTKSSGGSSGGEGALLGAGASLIGIGSDLAGSVRLPAMLNSVFAHKPTSEIISFHGHYPASSDGLLTKVCTIGPMVRYAKDLRLMMKLMCFDKVLPQLRLDQKVNLSQLKIFYRLQESNSIFAQSVQKEIQVAIEDSVLHLKNNCGCLVIEGDQFPEMSNATEMCCSTLCTINDVPNLLKAENQNLFVELFKSILGLSKITFNLLNFYFVIFLFKNFVLCDTYLQQNKYLKTLFTRKLGSDGVFLYPTFTQSGFGLRRSAFHTVEFSYLAIFNSLGLPSTHVPTGFDKNNLPIGIQVVAGPMQDRLCFAVAEELEKRFGGWRSP